MYYLNLISSLILSQYTHDYQVKHRRVSILISDPRQGDVLDTFMDHHICKCIGLNDDSVRGSIISPTKVHPRIHQRLNFAAHSRNFD